MSSTMLFWFLQNTGLRLRSKHHYLTYVPSLGAEVADIFFETDTKVKVFPRLLALRIVFLFARLTMHWLTSLH